MMKFAILLVVLLAAVPAAAQSTSTVTIGVPAAHSLDGAATVTLPDGAATQRGHLVVRSNTPWALVILASDNLPGLDWKSTGTAGWVMLGAATTVLRGDRGVHAIEYEVRRDPAAQRPGRAVVLTITVTASP